MRNQPSVILVVLILPSLAGIIQAVKFYQKHPESSVLQLALIAATAPFLCWGVIFLMAKCIEWMMTLRTGNHVYVTAGEYAGRTGCVLSEPAGAERLVKVRMDGSESIDIEISPILLRKKGLRAYLC